MTFKITHHSGYAAPDDALERLWQRLDGQHEEIRFDEGIRFSKVDPEIRATWNEDGPISVEHYEREEIGRRAVLDLVCEICADAPELESDWYAISVLR